MLKRRVRNRVSPYAGRWILRGTILVLSCTPIIYMVWTGDASAENYVPLHKLPELCGIVILKDEDN